MTPIIRKTSILAASVMLALGGTAMAGSLDRSAGTGGTNLDTGVSGSADAGTSTMERRDPAAQAEGAGDLDAGARVGGQGSNLSGSVGAQGDAGAAAGQPNHGSVISSINSAGANAEQIRALSPVSSVNVVEIDSLAGGEQGRAVENAVSRNETGIDDLRAAIETNAGIKAELDSRGVDMNDVIAAQADASGNVTVFARRS